MILKKGMKKGKKSDAVEAVQNMLKHMSFGPGPVDGNFGPDTEKAVVRFQESEGLYADGAVGPATMEALEHAYMRHVQVLTSPGIDSTDGIEDRLGFRKCKADKFTSKNGEEGFEYFYLRQDAAVDYDKVYKEVHKLGGILTSSGGRRALNEKTNSNRSATSFHYLGRALDLYLWSGMENPQTDPYVIKIDDPEDPGFEVFVRCKSENVKERPIENVVRYHESCLETRETITGRFVSLTEIFGRHGFQPIKPRRRFIEAGYPMAAEWWHFQYEKGLIPGISTFGNELLKVFSKQRLEMTALWRYRDRIFKINWL